MKCKSLLLISVISIYLLLGACLFALLEDQPQVPARPLPGPLMKHAELLRHISEDFPDANQTLLLAALGISPPKGYPLGDYKGVSQGDSQGDSQIIAEARISDIPENASYTVEPSGEPSEDGRRQPTMRKLPYGIRLVYWFSYCVSLLTTIGYGDVYPRSPAGKAFTLLYGSIGIPLVFVCIFKLGLMFRRTTRGLLTKVAHRVGALESLFKRRGYFPVEFPFHVIFYVILMVLIPSAIFYSVEKWSYGDSIYFSFVSLTTVGFGDLLVNQAHLGFSMRKVLLYKILTKAWLFSGLVWQACVLSILWSKLMSFPRFRGFIGPSRPSKSIVQGIPLENGHPAQEMDEMPSVGEEEKLNNSADAEDEKLKLEC